uniref:Uncharacterized protein n=1 Tax=Oryza punctata TaxID=4537 RepID=A0A0E0MM00_ORYPU
MRFGAHLGSLEFGHDEHVAERDGAEEHDGLRHRHGLHDGVRRRVGQRVEVNVHLHLLRRDLHLLHAAALLRELRRAEPLPRLPLLRPPPLRQEPPLPQHGDEVRPEHQPVQLRHPRPRPVHHREPVVPRRPERLHHRRHALHHLQRHRPRLRCGELADG